MKLRTETQINTAENALLNGLMHVKMQLSQIINLLSPSDYTQIPHNKSSIGAHARHIIEFMQAVENAASDLNPNNESTVNYDNRKRDMDIETSKDTALSSLNAVVEGLHEKLRTHGADHKVFMIEQLSNDDYSTPIPSSFGREIAYAIQHGIHHIYIIKTIAEKNGLTIDKNIGVAPATVTHQNNR